MAVTVLGHRGPAPEVLPEVLEGPVVLVAEHPRRLPELGEVARLEERVTGVRREPAPEIRAQHRHDHRAVAAAGLALDPAMIPVGDRAVTPVDERDDLVAQVRQVVAGSRRVDELTPAERGPAIDPDDDHGRRLAVGEQRVGELGEVLPERRAVAPHIQLAGEPLDHIHRREPRIRVVVVPRREVHPQRTIRGIVERVAEQRPAGDRVLVEASLRFERPGFHRGSFLPIRPADQGTGTPGVPISIV
jgi:hypothetical protein